MSSPKRKFKVDVKDFLQENSLEALIERTKCKTVRHPEYPNLVLLKYDMINSPMGDELVQQCRGLIVDEADNWNVVSYPYDKFFNYGEGHAAEIEWDDGARIYEKVDGSLMTLYRYDNKWIIASNGTPHAGGQVSFDPEDTETYKELFWRVWNEKGYELPTGFENYCFMFELMTPKNRVVVPHKENRLVLHGIRNVKNYKEYKPDFFPDLPKYDIVQTYSFKSFQEILNKADTLDGIQQEGYVVCDNKFNRVKVKAKTYVAIHYLKSVVDIPESRDRRFLEIALTNENSEFLDYFPEYQADFDKVNNGLLSLCEYIDKNYEKVKDIENQKEFALAVKDKIASSAYFNMRKGFAHNAKEYFMQFTAKKTLPLIYKHWRQNGS